MSICNGPGSEAFYIMAVDLDGIEAGRQALIEAYMTHPKREENLQWLDYWQQDLFDELKFEIIIQPTNYMCSHYVARCKTDVLAEIGMVATGGIAQDGCLNTDRFAIYSEYFSEDYSVSMVLGVSEAPIDYGVKEAWSWLSNLRIKQPDDFHQPSQGE